MCALREKKVAERQGREEVATGRRAVGSRSTLVCNALHRHYRYYPYYTYYEYYTDVRATSREQRPGEERLLLLLSPSLSPRSLRPLTLLPVPSVSLHPSSCVRVCPSLPPPLFSSLLFSSFAISRHVCSSTHGFHLSLSLSRSL